LASLLPLSAMRLGKHQLRGDSQGFSCVLPSQRRWTGSRKSNVYLPDLFDSPLRARLNKGVLETSNCMDEQSVTPTCCWSDDDDVLYLFLQKQK
jgi:hypothetical protein